MKLTTWIHSVATGRIRHWNDTNNQLLTEMWSVIQTFDEPLRSVMTDVVVSSSLLVDKMLGPKQGREAWLGVDMLAVQRSTLEEIYNILIDVFLAADYLVIPEIKPFLIKAKFAVLGKGSVAPEITELLARSRSDADIATQITREVAQQTWEKIARLVKSKREKSASSLYIFTVVLLAQMTENAKRLNAFHRPT